MMMLSVAKLAAVETPQSSQSITNNPHNLICVVPESIPYHYLDPETGQVAGTEIDILKKQLTTAGLGTPDFAIYSWKRALTLANSQPATLIMPLSRTAEREEKYHWLKILRETRFSIFSLNQESISPAQIIEEEITIYCENGGIQCDLLMRDGVPESLVQRFEGVSHDKIVDLAIAGRIKYFLAEEDLVQVGLAERGLEQTALRVNYTIKQSVGDYLAISRDNDPTLVNALKQALNREE